jgi:hypothetical protein
MSTIFAHQSPDAFAASQAERCMGDTEQRSKQVKGVEIFSVAQFD